MAYYRDCGSGGSFPNTIFSWIGKVTSFNNFIPTNVYTLFLGTPDATRGHSGDSEFIILDLQFSNGYQHWYVQEMITSAHYGTGADGTRRSTYQGAIEWGDATQHPGGYPAVWVAHNKHANYPTRDWCNAGRGFGGLAHDNCDPNSLYTQRLAFVHTRNVGSFQQNLPAPLSCVTSQLRPAFNPGTECFWKMPTTSSVAFNGWMQYPYGEPPTVYGAILVARFECFALSGQYDGTCLDRGVVR